MPCPLVSIFIPTYNRAHLIGRALQSIINQDYSNVEIIIVDDGSQDNTYDLISEYKKTFLHQLFYIYKNNGGKHSAFNTALPRLNGEFTIILDSDDKLAPNAILKLIEHWYKIPENIRHMYCGVEGLCAFMESKEVAGNYFPSYVFDSDYISIKNHYNIRGDKKNMIKTSILKQYPYPEFPGETHIRPSLLWKRIAHKYRTRFINEIVQYIEYQSDGLSSDRAKIKNSNIQGYKFYYLEDFNDHQPTLQGRLNSAIKYVYYSLQCNIGISQQYKEAKHKLTWIFSYPIGYLKFIRTKLYV